jgi:hypothetical protein
MKQSRVLAALGGQPLFDVPQRSEARLNILTRKGVPSYESPAESSAKKRASTSLFGGGSNPTQDESNQFQSTPLDAF